MKKNKKSVPVESGGAELTDIKKRIKSLGYSISKFSCFFDESAIYFTMKLNGHAPISAELRDRIKKMLAEMERKRV